MANTRMESGSYRKVFDASIAPFSLDPWTFWKRVLFIYAVGQLEIINGISDRARENSSPFRDASGPHIYSLEKKGKRAIWNVKARCSGFARSLLHENKTLLRDSEARVGFISYQYFYEIIISVARREKFGSRVGSNIDLYYWKARRLRAHLIDHSESDNVARLKCKK